MSKEREDFEALFPKDRLEKVKNTEIMEAAFEGFLLGCTYYQPLLDAKDAEIMRYALLADKDLELRINDAERIATLKALLEQAREFVGSFYFAVADSYYKDVSLTFCKPHSLDMRIANDSSKSFIFAEFEKSRKELSETLAAINAASGGK